MIVLPKKQVHLVISGSMTKVYRPAERPYKLSTGSSVGVHPLEYELVDGVRTRPERCRVTIESIDQTTLDVVSFPDALKAGYEGLEHLYAEWRERWRTGPLTAPPVVVYEVSRDSRERPAWMARGGGHTSSPALSIDPECELVQDVERLELWASRAREQAKAAWKLERRGGRRAA